MISVQNILSDSICVSELRLLRIKSCEVLRILIVCWRLTRSIIPQIKTLFY